MFDWMHCFLVGGILQKETTLCMLRLRHLVGYPQVHGYLKQFVWPHSLGGSGSGVTCCSEKSTKARAAVRGGMIKFKCMASEGLAFTPEFALFLMSVLLGSGAVLESPVLEAIHSFLALADVIEILQLAATGLTNAAILQTTRERYMDLFVACYCGDPALPKHHFVRHLPATWARLGFFACMFRA